MGSKYKILIVAGGTGGHFYPGFSLGQNLIQKGHEVRFVCKKRDICIDLLKKNNIDYYEISLIGLPRKLGFKLIKFPFLLIKSYFESRKILKNYKPSIVLGMGAYLSYPVILAAKKEKIPILIHEQNSIPGLANKMLAKHAVKIAAGFENALKYFPSDKAVYTGNPVRKELFKADNKKALEYFGIDNDKFRILIFGGSQGARHINHIAVECLRRFDNCRDNLQFIHICGKNDIEMIRDKYREYGIDAKVYEYLDDIGNAYAIADLIICRAGASTISELMILNKPAILIPFPHATGNHQEYNALELVKKGNAMLLKDKDLYPDVLCENISKYLAEGKKDYKLTLPEEFPQDVLAGIIDEMI